MTKEEIQKNSEHWYNKYKDVEKRIEELEKELEQEKKLNAEIKARFVKCNTCTDEMKDKCLMFSENLCEGERCEELVDLMALVSQNDLQKENEQLKQQIADIKANCDLAIEGRDIKIKELEDHLAEEVELHLHAEDYIKSLEQQIEKMKCCENCAYRTVDLLTFKPFCDKRKLGIENPLTCKCDKWKLVN